MNEKSQNSNLNELQGIVRARREKLNKSHQIGLDLLKSGEYKKAAKIFLEEIAASPNFCFSYHYLGESLFKLGQISESEVYFAKSRQLNPYFAPTQAFLGDIALKKGDFNKAVEFYQVAIQLNPNLFQAYQGFLKILFDSGGNPAKLKMTEVNDLFSQIIKLASRNRQWLIELLDLGISDTEFYVNLGDYLQTVNQTDSAIVCYQLALAQDPSQAEIWLKIALIFFDAGHNDYADECQSQAAKLEKDSIEIHSLQGDLWKMRNKFTEAIRAYQRAAELDPENPQYHKKIGDLQAKQGLINEAQLSYFKAIELGYTIY